MELCLTIAVTITLLLATVASQGLISFGTDDKCRDCCGQAVLLSGEVKICVEKQWCKHGIWSARGGQLRAVDMRGTEYEGATFALIYPNGVSNSITRCTVQGFPKLESIYGEMLQITVIERNAFWNLPGLRHIYLAFNSLKEVRYGIFSSLPVETLDLSWNEIGYISEAAFKGTSNLISLNLTHNRLVTLDLLQANFPLEELLASHNSLETVNVNSYTNLTLVDLSFNLLKKFDVPNSKRYKLIDLTGNYLSDLTLGSSTVVSLRLGLNNLTSITPLMTNSTKIKNIVIFPNPFDCSNLDRLLKRLIALNVGILKSSTDKRLNFVGQSYPVCALKDSDAYENYDDMRPKFVKLEKIPCSRDGHCPSFMICKNRKCWEPCSFGACKKQNLPCQTKDHVLLCRCPPGQFLNQTQLFSPCYAVCLQDSDCSDEEYCDEKNICSAIV